MSVRKLTAGNGTIMELPGNHVFGIKLCILCSNSVAVEQPHDDRKLSGACTEVSTWGRERERERESKKVRKRLTYFTLITLSNPEVFTL